MKFRKKPVIVEAMRWMGGDHACLTTFCGKNWSRADAVGSEAWPSQIPDKEQVVVYNSLQETWLPVPTGWWIIRGIRGQLYPVSPGVFAETYEVVDDSRT